MIRAIPGSALEDRPVMHVGNKVLRSRAKMVKPERVTKKEATEVVEELVRVLRGPTLPGRGQKGGSLVATQLGVPSRLMVYEDTQDDINDLSQEEKDLTGRNKPFGPKVIFNPRVKTLSNKTAVHWERSRSLPGYRALVERPISVQVQGLNARGREVDYIAEGWEARLALQAADALDGAFFIDKCVIRSLRHLETQNDPLPLDCPQPGESGATAAPMSEEQLRDAAEKGGSRGFLAGVPGIGRPNVLLAGSLLLRLRAEEVTEADIAAGKFNDLAKELREAIASKKHPLGVSGPNFGKSLRAVAIGEVAEVVDKMSARTRVQEEHRAFGPIILFNPVLKRVGNTKAYFFERTPTVPGYEGVVGRALEVEVQALDEKGSPVKFTAKGWQARQLQHTVDVLNGVLYTDRMERRSFRRDNLVDDLPEDVPFGTRTVAKKAARPDKPRRRQRGLPAYR